MYTTYLVKIHCDKITAGLPANIKAVQGWLQKNSSDDYLQEHVARLENLGADMGSADMSIFARDDDGHPAYESRCLIGALKESANVLKKYLGLENARSKLVERVFVAPPYRPYIALPGDIKVSERPIHVFTPQGPRDSLAVKEYMENVPMEFALKILNDPDTKQRVTADHVHTILEHMQDNGIGSDRKNGSGTFTLTYFDTL